MRRSIEESSTAAAALRALAHPLAVTALAALLINDHLLRWVWPGWWTGKLGDAAWLVFFPLALTLALAWLPLPGPKRRRWTAGLAFLLTGAGFVLLKSSPVAMHAFVAAAGQILPGQFTLLADASDLLMLPALGLGWLAWRESEAGAPFERRRAGLVLLPLAALLTVANSGMPEAGIQCFWVDGTSLVSEASYQSYTSADGGLTWQTEAVGQGRSCSRQAMEGEWAEVEGGLTGERFRYRPGASIEVSRDGGQSWQVGYATGAISEAQAAYWVKTRPLVTIEQTPTDAINDPVSGNVLFAMGQQGVLVRTASGGWVWATMPDFAPAGAFPTSDAAALLLGAQGYLAFGLVLLLASSFLLRWTRAWPRVVILVLAWLAWLATGLLFPPATSFGYSASVTALGLLAMFILIVPLLIEQIVRVVRRPAESLGLAGLAGLALLGGLLYLLPYTLWLFSTLPSILWATLFGFAIAAGVLAAGLLRRA